MEKYVTGTGQKLLVHDKADCTGNFCVIHRPSPHAMSAFPTHWRGDRQLMERICPHGIGHPDPDDIAFKRNRPRFGEDMAKADSIHGCDGCCQGPKDA